MKIAPDQLYTTPGVEIIARARSGGGSAILYKTLDAPLHDRSIFARMPSLSFLSSGEKLVSTKHDGARFSIGTGDVLALPADIYQISDLLPDNGGNFESLLVFIERETLEAFVRTLPTRGVRAALDILEPEKPDASDRDRLIMRASESLNVWQASLRPLFRSLRSGDESPADRAGTFRSDQLAHDPVGGVLRTKLIEVLQLLCMSEPAIGEWARRMCAPLKGEAGGTGEHARDLRSFMLRHYDRPLSIEDFARLTGRSNSTFLRDFKRSFGQTPREWLLGQRMEKARSMIEGGQTNITDVAADLGYESISHFIRNFKRRFGKTPGAWARISRS